MKSCIEAVRGYFDARTENWLACDAALFKAVAQPNVKWLARTVHQAKQKQRAYAAQGKRLCRASTKVNVTELKHNSDKRSVQIMAVEQICWAYSDKQAPAVECRLIYHRQLWQYVDHAWLLMKAWESSDGRSLSKEDEVARVKEKLLTPKGFVRENGYDRVRATRYADVWWDQFNPRYPKLSDDCTNFISQCLHAGGLPMMHKGNRHKGWWVDGASGSSGAWSYSWTTSNALYQHLRKNHHATLLQRASELKMGDLIFYDWSGSGGYHHTTIVTDFDDAGEPLVNAHTDPSFHRPYTYYDSRAWTENTRYAFVHIPDGL